VEEGEAGGGVAAGAIGHCQGAGEAGTAAAHAAGIYQELESVHAAETGRLRSASRAGGQTGHAGRQSAVLVVGRGAAAEALSGQQEQPAAGSAVGTVCREASSTGRGTVDTGGPVDGHSAAVV
jgi:hypothetical protein